MIPTTSYTKLHSLLTNSNVQAVNSTLGILNLYVTDDYIQLGDRAEIVLRCQDKIDHQLNEQGFLDILIDGNVITFVPYIPVTFS